MVLSANRATFRSHSRDWNISRFPQLEVMYHHHISYTLESWLLLCLLPFNSPPRASACTAFLGYIRAFLGNIVGGGKCGKNARPAEMSCRGKRAISNRQSRLSQPSRTVPFRNHSRSSACKTVTALPPMYTRLSPTRTRTTPPRADA